MRALGDIGEKRASQALRERFVHDQHGQGAEAALDGLARLADPASQPVFFEQVASKDADLRRAAFEGLARLGDVAAIRAVEARTGGEQDRRARLARAFALARDGGRGLPELIKSIGDDRLAEQVMAYLVELGRIHVTALVPTLADPDVPTRGRIVQVLGILGGPEALQALEPSTRDPDPAVARAAEHAIARIQPHDAVSTRPRRRRALSRDFFARPTLDVARDLIGTRLVHEVDGVRAAGIIVETEAYIGEDDPACHAAAGLTRRTAPLYGPPGLAYVYLNYGMHFLLNAVTEAEGHPAAVLIRALAPEDGLEVMRQRRGLAASPRADQGLCRGPGNLTRALGVALRENGADLCGASSLWIEAGPGAPGPLVWGPRIGIRVGVDTPWRCAVADHPAVSGRRAPARRG